MSGDHEWGGEPPPDGCTNPEGTAGAILYNEDHAVMQWCDGARWIGFKKPPIPKTVFVTSTTYDGNLAGTSGADSICNTRAAAGGLSGTYKAWIAGPTIGPFTSFSKAGPLGQDFIYTRTDGVVIATSWADLTSGTIAAPINRDEFGDLQSDSDNVWSNANSAGNPAEINVHCSIWSTDSGGSNRGRAGSSNATNADWADSDNPQCNNTLRLYCFEQ